MTAADELKAAAEKMRGFPGPAAEPMAKLLEDCADLHEPHVPGQLIGYVPPGCQWCADEDFPCADMRNALAVARVINGSSTP